MGELEMVVDVDGERVKVDRLEKMVVVCESKR